MSQGKLGKVCVLCRKLEGLLCARAHLASFDTCLKPLSRSESRKIVVSFTPISSHKIFAHTHVRFLQKSCKRTNLWLALKLHFLRFIFRYYALFSDHNVHCFWAKLKVWDFLRHNSILVLQSFFQIVMLEV